MYMQVAMYGSSLSNPTVADSQSGGWKLLRSGSLGSVWLWVFRRMSPVSASSSFTVTVTPSSSTSPIEIVAIEVLNDGSPDNSSSTDGSGTLESGNSSVSIDGELVLFLGADQSATFSSWGSGQTGISGYPTAPTNVTAWGSYQYQINPGGATVSPTRTVTASTSFVTVTIAISFRIPWTQLSGRPTATVSAIGQSTTPATALMNDGADFGPDTPGTSTCGIQEAIDSGAQEIHLIGKGNLFNTSSPIYLPAYGGIRLVGVLTNQNTNAVTGNTAGVYINYSGTDFAIKTNSSAANSQYIKGFVDGIAIYAPNGSGIWLDNAFYNIGSMWIGGNLATGSVGLQWDQIGNAAEMHAMWLHIDGFENLIVTSAEHLSIDHLNTSYTSTNTPLISHQGYGLTILYWHHFANGPTGGTAPLSLIDVANDSAVAVHIVNLLWESSNYTNPTLAWFSYNKGQTGGPTPVFFPAITIGNLDLVTSGVSRQPPTVPLWVSKSLPTSGIPDFALVTNFSGQTRLPIIVGVDDRVNLNATDPSPITIYTVSANDEFLAIEVEICPYAYASGTISYDASYTDSAGGSKGVAANATSNAQVFSRALLRCKAGTNVTVQVTANGNSSTFAVACTVTRIQYL